VRWQKGNSACGQKEAKPGGTLDRREAWGHCVPIRSHWREERPEVAACACHSGGNKSRETAVDSY